MSTWQMDLIHVGTEPNSLLPQLVQAAGLAPSARLAEI